MPAPAGIKAVKKPGEEAPEEQQSFLRKYVSVSTPENRLLSSSICLLVVYYSTRCAHVGLYE